MPSTPRRTPRAAAVCNRSRGAYVPPAKGSEWGDGGNSTAIPCAGQSLTREAALPRPGPGGLQTALGQVCWGCRPGTHFSVALLGLRVVYSGPLAPSPVRAGRAPGGLGRASPRGDEEGWRIGGLPLVSGAQSDGVPHL